MRCRLIFVASAVLSLATWAGFTCPRFQLFGLPSLLASQFGDGYSASHFRPANLEIPFAGRRSLLLVAARVCCQLQRDRRSCAGIESVTAGAGGTALVPSVTVHRSGTKVLWVHWWREFLGEFPGISGADDISWSLGRSPGLVCGTCFLGHGQQLLTVSTDV